MDTKQAIIEGKTALGIEFGSTRIKAVLIGDDFAPVATGAHDWENRLENGLWTYRLEDVQTGLQNCFGALAADVRRRWGVPLETTGAMGISAMMHGYLVFDSGGSQLVPFRTWRNTITEKAAAELTSLFQFNIPQRWSVAHLYQAILNGEAHAKDIAHLTTLAGYVHWKLTGKQIAGLNEASGIFPLDSVTNNYDSRMLERFRKLVAPNNFKWDISGILPEVLRAGETAGSLTEEGAKLLDPTGSFRAGIPLCPPEGDAGTGMVATNSVAERTGNVSAGTSIFAMIVLEKPLSKVYPEIDMVATPGGKPVAMVHCNNCTTDLDAWVKLFRELADLAGAKIDKAALYDALYFKALEGEEDCGGLLSYNFYSGEHLTGIQEGRPLFVRLPDSNFTLANFMRTLLFSTMGTLKLGMDILTGEENVRIDSLLGHGGLFKTEGVGQRLMASALNTPVSVMASAGEGGAWGIALLAAYISHTAYASHTTHASQKGGTLEKFLSEKVFAGEKGVRTEPNPKDAESFRKFMERYAKGLEIEQAAIKNFNR